LDIAAAYPLEDLRSWRREAVLDRRQGTVTITDEWLHTGTPERPDAV
jgi:hypothetical protein